MSHCSPRFRFPARDVTMAPKEPQPCVEGMSLSGEMASACLLQADSREGAYITVQATSGVAHRRSLYDTEARPED